MMKKYFNFALLSAIALTGTIGFTACSSSDDVAAVENNPTYDPVKGTVKSQFVLNIASNVKTTRSGATTVQAGGENFRGIDNTLLFAFKTSGKGFVDATIAGAAAANRYDLGTVAAAGSLNNKNDESAKSHRILELAMPTGTDAMLFYGKAIKSSTDKDEEVGKVTYSIPASIATGFSFALNNRVAGNSDKYEHAAQILAAIMTKIVNVSGTYTVVKANYPSWPGSDGDVLTSTWKEMNPEAKPGGQGRTLSPLEEILHKAFTTLTSYGPNELRGGSSNAIHTTVKDLYSVTIKVANATPTSPYEELAKHLAQQINTQITNFFTSSENEAITGFKGVDGIKSAMGTSWNNDWNDVVSTDISKDNSGFPTTFNLPEGAAQLEYTASTNTFSHKHPGTSLLDKSTTTQPTAYTFPAELMYYCNSGLRTSNTEKTDAKFPNGVTNWDTEAQWTTNGWESGSNVVTSATRATAMTKNVNYGVAMLKTTVQIKEGVSALEDNRKALNPGEENKSFSPTNINFTWTGVIIGGQPASVDWQFLPTTTSFDKLVYDNHVAGLVAGTAVPTTAGQTSTPNYTILFDNYIASETQNKVRVALQFVNNGDDFWGRDNLVRKGQTFYLVAELDPGTKDVTWDSYYQIPPLNASGISTKTPRVFIQDYMTTATFSFFANDAAHTSSLQNAYVTLPDLRSSQLSFGLSVDLDWRTGMSFDVDLGGN